MRFDQMTTVADARTERPSAELLKSSPCSTIDGQCVMVAVHREEHLMVGVATFRKLQAMESSMPDDGQLLLRKPPLWAVDLVKDVAHTQARSDLPTIYWRRYKGQRGTSGL